MKNIAILFLLCLLAIPAIGQKVIADYPLTGKPVFEMRYVDPWPDKTLYYMRHEQPCAIEVHTTVAGKELDFCNYQVSLENNQGTVDTVPSHPNQFIITPKLTTTRGRLRIYFHCTTVGYQLMNPIPKPGSEGRCYDSQGNVIRENIMGWQPIAGIDPDVPFLMDSIIMLVVNPK